VQAYEREQQRRATEVTYTRGFVRGNPGDGVVIELTVRRVLRWALICQDADGHAVICRKKTYKTDDATVAVGDVVRVSAKLGETSTYNGVDQSFLTAPAIYRLTDTMPASVTKRAREQAQREGADVPAWAVQAPQAKRSRKGAAS
jgi:hypothetical protein